MWSIAIHTLEGGMIARSALYTTGGSGVSVSPSRVSESVPTARSGIRAFVAMVAKALAIGTLSEGVEAQAAFGSIGGRKGRQPSSNEGRCSGARYCDNYRGGRLAST